MTIATLLLLAAMRCASPGSCPSTDELRQAYREEQWNREIQMMQALSTEDPTNYYTVSTPRLLRLSDIYCDTPDEKRIIRCKVTARYSAYISYEIVTLSRDKEGWTILERSNVLDRTSRR